MQNELTMLKNKEGELKHQLKLDFIHLNNIKTLQAFLDKNFSKDE